MYERFTDRARKVMQLANQEAMRFNHENLGTEHVLLGLVKEGSGVAANVLKNLGIDLRTIRLEIEKFVHPRLCGEQTVTGRLPHTPETKQAIEQAMEEARTLDHNWVGTEHILLGLMRGSCSQDVLSGLGVDADKVRAEVQELLAGVAAKKMHFRPDGAPTEKVVTSASGTPIYKLVTMPVQVGYLDAEGKFVALTESTQPTEPDADKPFTVLG